MYLARKNKQRWDSCLKICVKNKKIGRGVKQENKNEVKENLFRAKFAFFKRKSN